MTDKEWKRPDALRKCTYSPSNNKTCSPHHHAPMRKREKIASSVLDLMFDSPMIRLNHIPKREGVECEILVKCEFLNPGGSVKDRIALRMIEQAERDGILKPGDTIIEPTSGNTGIGLAIVAVQKKYHCIIVMPEKMSAEKEQTLSALGAEIVRTPTSVAFDHEDSNLRVAEALKVEIGPRAHILNQYMNPYNPIEHYDQTSREIIRDCTTVPNEKSNLEMVVVSTGTGGTSTGISARIKEELLGCRIIGVEPVGSTLSDTTGTVCPKPYDMEGIGYDFCPTVLDRSSVDSWVQVTDRDAFRMARRLIREEGLLCGGSSGSAVWAAIQMAKKEGIPKHKKIVVILPDSIRNYMSKFVSDSWMYGHGYIDFPESSAFRKQWDSKEMAEFVRSLTKAEIVQSDTSIKQAVRKLRKLQLRRLVVVNPEDNNEILGIFDNRTLQSLLSGKTTVQDPVSKVMAKDIRHLSFDINLEELGRHLMTEPYVLFKHQTDIWIVDQDEFLQWTVSSTTASS